MQKSNIKKGYALVEVTISLLLMIILFIGALNIYIYAMKIKKENQEENRRINFVLALKYHMLLNESYEELADIKTKPIIINDRSMDIKSLAQGKGLIDFKSNQVFIGKPYIIIRCEGKEIIKVTVKYYKTNNKEKNYFIIYKGKNLI